MLGWHPLLNTSSDGLDEKLLAIVGDDDHFPVANTSAEGEGDIAAPYRDYPLPGSRDV